MALKASLFSNGDDCFLAWATQPIPNCWGFAIWRDLDRNGKRDSRYIENRTGFAGDKNPPHSHQPSDKWPFQRFNWTDHEVSEGDSVSYTISPVIYNPSSDDTETIKHGTLAVDKNASVSAGPIKVTANATGGAAAYFNRGFLLSQFVAKALGDNFDKRGIKKLVDELQNSNDQLRKFLYGQVGQELLNLLDEAERNKWDVYAVLYELSDEQLITKLKALGKRAHVILSNGSSKKKGTDGNAAAAHKLGKSIDLTRRMLWSKGLGHNKFAVFATGPDKRDRVWTGSTNWAHTGLCTQINNSLLIEDKRVVEAYKKQYSLLKSDKARFGEPLMRSNDVPKSGIGKVGHWKIWFTRTQGAHDLEDVAELINEAKQAILFLMFEPGSNGLLQVIQARLSSASQTRNDELYVHGVVNSLKNPKTASINLVSRGENRPFDLQVVQPEGVSKSIGQWAAEVTRRDFLKMQGGVVGFAIIHSKVIVLDPFTEPIVVTGSHNFSAAASGKNDENLIIVRGNAELAQRYAVNIMGVYQHYRWRKYLLDCYLQHKKPWEGLEKGDSWQGKGGDSRRVESEFWLKTAIKRKGAFGTQ